MITLRRRKRPTSKKRTAGVIQGKRCSFGLLQPWCEFASVERVEGGRIWYRSGSRNKGESLTGERISKRKMCEDGYACSCWLVTQYVRLARVSVGAAAQERRKNNNDNKAAVDLKRASFSHSLDTLRRGEERRGALAGFPHCHY